jgi:hypothetical protein
VNEAEWAAFLRHAVIKTMCTVNIIEEIININKASQLTVTKCVIDNFTIFSRAKQNYYKKSHLCNSDYNHNII